MDELKTNNLFNLEETLAKELLEKFDYPFEALKDIESYIYELIEKLSRNEYLINGNIAFSKSTVIHPSAVIKGPTIIGSQTEIRPNAYIRENVIIGNSCVIGNSCEFKNSIIFNEAQIPHFNYVGDSIIGYNSHLGAGVITSNLKSDKSTVTISYKGEKIITNLRKMGAIIGDYTEVGCNSVLNPGTIIGKNSNIYPLSSVRGFVPENSIYKNENKIIQKMKIIHKSN
jgi:NDP-sugar pyrophosphorylase family protein